MEYSILGRNPFLAWIFKALLQHLSDLQGGAKEAHLDKIGNRVGHASLQWYSKVGESEGQ